MHHRAYNSLFHGKSQRLAWVATLAVSPIFCGATAVAAPAGTTSATNALPKEVQQLLRQGYRIRAEARGDLNGDPFEDRAVVLEDGASEEGDRVTLLLTGQADGSMRLAARNAHAVYCAGCGGAGTDDPLLGISIRRQILRIVQGGGAVERWGSVLSFRYDPKEKDWLFLSEEEDDFPALEASEDALTTTEISAERTGKITFSEFTWEKITQ